MLGNSDLWKKLSPENQKIFYEAGALAIKVNREVDVQLMNKLPQSGLSVEEYCKKNDIKVVELSPQEREAFKVSMTKVWDKYREKIGPELFNFFLGKIQNYSGK